MSWTEIIALIGAVAALIAAVTELIKVLKPLLQSDGEDRSTDPDPERRTPPRPPVSRRTTWSLALGSIAAVFAVLLVVIVSFTDSASNSVVDLVLLAVIGIFAWPGAALGVEKAWTVRATDRRLAINAASGTVVGLLAWVSALVVTAPSW